MPETRSCAKLDDRYENLVQRLIHRAIKDEVFIAKIIQVAKSVLKQEYEGKIQHLEEKVGQLESALQEKSETGEQHTRLNNIRIFGIKQHENENTNKLVTQLL